MFKISKIKFFGIILFVSLFIFSLKAQEKKYDLSLNLEVGNSFTMDEQIIQHITQEVTGMKQEVYQTNKTLYTMKVESKTDSDYTFLITYDHIYYEVNNPLTGINKYDSEKDGMNTEEPMFKNFGALAGKSFGMRMLKTGAVRELTGIDETIDAMIKDMDISDTAEVSAKKAELRALLGGGRLKSSFENAFNVYPEEKVNAGDTWTKTNLVTTVFPIEVQNTFTLDLAKKKKFEVSLKSTLASDPEDIVEANDMEMSYDLKGEMNGSFELDGTTKMPRLIKIKQTISGKVSMSSVMYGEMAIPMSVETEVTKTIK